MKPVIFGETVIDVFADGTEVLGGSALNVAWCLTGLGLPTRFITRLGQDALGAKYDQLMRNWGMDPQDFQSDSQFSTCTIKVFLDDKGEAKYQSALPPTAIDAIEMLPHLKSLDASHLLYHGTYIMRAERSRETLLKLRAQGVKTFVDVNLRTPFWELSSALEMITGASFVKMNEEEFVLLGGSFDGELEKVARAFIERYHIGSLLLTLGEKGAWLIEKDAHSFAPALKVGSDYRDSVGAGDAFCAGFLYSLALKSTHAQALERAVKFAAQVCTLHGATTDQKDFYQKARRFWQG